MDAYILAAKDLNLHELDQLMDEKAMVVDGVENIRVISPKLQIMLFQ